jgi:RNA polymerase-binding transcription factor DksA
MSEAGKKAVETKKRKKTGKRVAEHRRKLMNETKHLLLKWKESTHGKEACVVCGDSVPPTILQRHHVNPFDKSEGKVMLCASCHNIYNKAKESTNVEDIVRDFNIRHRKFSTNLDS